MEHEVFVPFPAERLREALADPACVARAVPGLQQDAGARPVTGRLKLRVGGHSITYRGAVRVTGRDDGAFAVEGDATESRGSGTAALALTVRVRGTDGGTTLTFTGTATADGRLTELPQDAVASALLRLLDRFAENLGAVAGENESKGESEGDGEGRETGAAPADDVPPAADPAHDGADAPAADAPDTDTDTLASVFDTDVPPSSLDPDADGSDAADDDEDAAAAAAVPVDGADIAEAAHARRTMIGRSAEEVDHAPPRGRYAPVPAPQSIVAQTPLRWAAPAAAVVLASAIVVGRVLRKRK